jgi:alpha-tubulin suppressor-like RCC1 family protein
MAAPSGLAAAAGIAFRQVSAGDNHACGINANSRAFCWGDNFVGQLGDGTKSDHLQPVPVATTVRFRGVDAAAFATCGVTTDDRVFCWGSFFEPLASTQPEAAPGNLRFRSVTVGSEHVCAITRDDGRAYCWGSGSFGQLGNGGELPSPTPSPVAGNRRFRQLAAGERHTCGLTTGDEIFCWGSNQWGQLGFESDRFARFSVPTKVAGTRRYLNLTAGRLHTCAVTVGSKAFCWGDGRNWTIGDGKNFIRFTPRAVAGGLTFRRLTAGYQHTCGETAGNQVYCWGADFAGGQGDGETDPPFNDFNPRPTAVVGGLRFAQVSAGRDFTCGKTTADAGYCWGYNARGQLGDGTQTNRSTPTGVAGPS